MICTAKAAGAAAFLCCLSLSVTAADLRVATSQLPAALDPIVSTLGTNWLVAANACEGLFALDDNWQPPLMLAPWAAG